MKYNNQYYKIIAQLLDESVDNRHHTDLYYTKRIAESYGETYTDLGNVNKYLREFAKDVGVELDNKHHTRLYYLREIAKVLYDGELEHNTENYYLRIISENIEEPTPTGFSLNIKVTKDGSPVTGKEIFDAYNQTKTYTTNSNGEIKNIGLPTIPNQNGAYILTDLLDGVDQAQKGYFEQIVFAEFSETLKLCYNMQTMEWYDTDKKITLHYIITGSTLEVRITV